MRKERKFPDSILYNPKMEQTLRSAHITIPVDTYMMFTCLMTMLSGFFILIVGLLVFVLGIEIPVISSVMPTWTFAIIAALIIGILVFYGFYFYPVLEAQGRKNRIEQDLPYAITYMQALSSTITLYDVFRSIYDAKDLYGEVSTECGLIVRDVELFGEDLLTSMENTMKITPSDTFRELLNDLCLVYRSGGNMRNFFNSKSESYREIARQKLDSMLQFLEMMAEVYVTAFVAAPIAIIIMLVAENISGQNTLGDIMPLMFILLPVGAIILIVIMYILLPPDTLDITKRETRDNEFGVSLLNTNDTEKIDTGFVKQINSRKRVLHILNIIRHPVKFYISNYTIPLIFSFILALVTTYIWWSGYLAAVFPTYTLQVFICLLLIVFMLPPMLAYEIRKKYVNTIERQMPEFLREISEMRDIGMTLQGAISMISGNKTGILSSEVNIVATEINYGSQLSSALVRMEERIGLVTVKRAISLLVRASEVTDYIRETLTIAIADLEHYIKMKSKRLNVSFAYLAVIYLSYGIYLYCAYQMNVAFISSFSNYNLGIDMTANKTDMFNLGIILAFFSGLMAGQMSSNSLLCGLKHAMILLVSTIVVFVLLI